MVKFEIKKLSQDRWLDYKKLRLEALKNDPIAFGSSFEEEIALTEEAWRRRIGDAIFAMVNDMPVGMVVCSMNDRIKTKHVASIYSVYVAADFRNEGIGDELLSAAISLIKENKQVLKIKLSVNPSQVFAVKLYKKHGFTVYGIEKNELYFDGKYYDELLKEKVVQSSG